MINNSEKWISATNYENQQEPFYSHFLWLRAPHKTGLHVMKTNRTHDDYIESVFTVNPNAGCSIYADLMVLG